MKTFKEFVSVEETMTSAAAGIPHDTANMGPRKKKMKYPVSRRFIEIMGKMRRIERQ